MLYSEFLEGTHAPDNVVSYIIYSGLNHIYTWHEDYTRMEAYRDGRKILEALDNVGAMKQITENDINRQEPDKERK